MLKYFAQGLLLGLSYVAPIGTQNLYVINSAIKKTRLKALQTALITVVFDVSLAAACFFGIGFLIDKSFVLRNALLLIGGSIVTYIGIGLIRTSAGVSDKINVDNSLIKIVTTCFVVTWFNPQAVIDGSLLLGGYKASLPQDMSKYFILGVCTASFLWFTSLSSIISTVKHSFNSKVIKIINIVCGIIIVVYGIKLMYTFFFN
ncbi:LysE family transporter [Clostridium sp. YIM B02515]|uniref:LysE family transporter n=1 Tax=Clostridium rhizosphaerae TaxID=2803861 RepID=A0ABS1TD10_9CLOT|nr:LysE family transporter [Clostridium rhizosphaerae]MBL4937244.1 LysE family transporter [Clostridium rhizosphaerae]